LKRIAIIGAAAAYTIAAADDNSAVKIAAEITSNGARRLGHQYLVSLGDLGNATDENLAAAYHLARLRIQTATDNEKATLDSVLELADDKKVVGDYVAQMKASIDQIGSTHLTALETHAKVSAKQLNTTLTKVQLTELESKAAKIVPKPTATVKSVGYGGDRELIDNVPEAEKEKYPYSRNDIASTRELHLLVDGVNSVLDIKYKLDVQHARPSDLQAILNYLEILKLAGLIAM
jgi:hypothetical protein